MRSVGICINARVQSSRCPQKLIRRFADTTLLDIALQKLSNINVKEKCLAAGDKEILDIYEKYSGEIKLLQRLPDAVAGGEHPHSVSFRHYGDMISDYILIMNPCLPFTTIQTYNAAIDYFINEHNIKSLTSVLKMKDIFFNKNGDLINLPNKDHLSSTTVSPLFKMAHVFHIINRCEFMNNHRYWSYEINDPQLYEVTKQECLDIDDEEDFRFCEFLWKEGYNKNGVMEHNANNITK